MNNCITQGARPENGERGMGSGKWEAQNGEADAERPALWIGERGERDAGLL